MEKVAPREIRGKALEPTLLRLYMGPYMSPQTIVTGENTAAKQIKAKHTHIMYIRGSDTTQCTVPASTI